MIPTLSPQFANCCKQSLLLVFLATLSTPGSAQVFQASPQPLTPGFCSSITGAGANAGQPGNGGVPAHQSGSQLRPMVRVFLNQNPLTDAVCNDGSPAAIYVRKAPTTVNGKANEHRNNWHMHLKGGGSCTSFKDCANRWCGVNSNNNALNQPGLMSTDGTPALARGTGIFRDDSSNVFSSYNQVMVYYCSSDGWIGNKPGTGIINAVRSFDPRDRGLPPLQKLDIEFRGTEIVEAAMDALESQNGLLFPNPDPRGGKTAKLPLLNKAELFLLSGDSAGANGVRHHLDRISDRLQTMSTTETGVTVLGALDAGGAPDLGDPLVNWSVVPSATSHGVFMKRHFSHLRAFHGVVDTALDESCVSLRGFNYKCLDSHLVQKNHITTPLFQRTSLEDTLMRRALVDTGMLATRQELRILTESGLADLEHPDTSALSEQRGPMQIMGPNCRSHVTFRGQRFFTQSTVNGETVHDALQGFVKDCDTVGCQALLDLDDPNPNPPGC